MKDLDFVIIGAQKCATTTLFELLRQHPDINMPLEKEVPFFTGEDCSPQAWDDFSKRYFSHGTGRLWGKATPQYMANAEVPGRLAALMPNTKLIALLRDPIERSRSQYRMGERRNTETRSFDEAMRDCLAPHALGQARANSAPMHTHGYESEGEFYLSWSEYGRILQSYRTHFEADQLLVLYLEDLEADPDGVLAQVLEFLELDVDFKPKGLGEVMHAGGGSNRISEDTRKFLRNVGPISLLWRMVPRQQQGRIRFLYERWNTKKTKEPLPLSPEVESELTDHFATDIRMLLKLGVALPPWADRYGVKASEIDTSASIGAAKAA